jgi:hypothetical protein
MTAAVDTAASEPCLRVCCVLVAAARRAAEEARAANVAAQQAKRMAAREQQQCDEDLMQETIRCACAEHEHGGTACRPGLSAC